ncbi:MAG TPA: endolytic transglycosylase MltG [Ignavibacteria bacterium]|nr:endolytic transglycosylase MltG [Ignavibacteria bacterium]
MTKNSKSGDYFSKRIGRALKTFILYIKNEVIPFISKTLDRIPYKKIRFIYPFAALLNILLLVYVVYNVFLDKNTWEDGKEKMIVIEKGSGFNEIVQTLLKNDVIENGFTFKTAAILTRRDGSIFPRKYIFQSGLSNGEILDMLTDSELNQTVKFRVPEGIKLKTLAKSVEKRFLIPEEDFIKATQNRSVMTGLGLGENVKDLEGFLYPDTYVMSINLSGDGVVKVFTDEFKRRVINDEELINALRLRRETLLEAVTLASIIEAETAMKSEMPRISGVYHNRLNRRMRLEADPTVQYVLPGGHKSRLLFEDLRIDSPYNTYRNYGLPPGPINNPGIEAIRAAIFPESHNFVFFVATGDGGHTFTETFEQHKEAAREYRRKLDQKNK